MASWAGRGLLFSPIATAWRTVLGLNRKTFTLGFCLDRIELDVLVFVVGRTLQSDIDNRVSNSSARRSSRDWAKPRS